MAKTFTHPDKRYSVCFAYVDGSKPLQCLHTHSFYTASDYAMDYQSQAKSYTPNKHYIIELYDHGKIGENEKKVELLTNNGEVVGVNFPNSKILKRLTSNPIIETSKLVQKPVTTVVKKTNPFELAKSKAEPKKIKVKKAKAKTK